MSKKLLQKALAQTVTAVSSNDKEKETKKKRLPTKQRNHTIPWEGEIKLFTKETSADVKARVKSRDQTKTRETDYVKLIKQMNSCDRKKPKRLLKRVCKYRAKNEVVQRTGLVSRCPTRPSRRKIGGLTKLVKKQLKKAQFSVLNIPGLS